MKNKTISVLFSLGLLIGSTSFAQTPSGQTRIIETRDYISSLINRISKENPARFSTSTDYSYAGPELQEKITNAVNEFQTTMDILAQ